MVGGGGGGVAFSPPCPQKVGQKQPPKLNPRLSQHHQPVATPRSFRGWHQSPANDNNLPTGNLSPSEALPMGKAGFMSFGGGR